MKPARANQCGAGNGAMELLFHLEGSWRAVPDRYR